MQCERVETLLGRMADDELDVDLTAQVMHHLRSCPPCRDQWQRIRRLTDELAALPRADVPEELWTRIEHRLAGDDDPAGAPLGRVRTMKPVALAASLLLALGLSLAGLAFFEQPARAVDVNFEVLLDALPLDPEKAFRKFLVLYDATPASPMDARRHAPDLDFATPAELPGGFVLRRVYLLRFGDNPGIAAAYARGNEFLAALFHPPVRHEHFGTHRDYPCVVGQHRGHGVNVGDWSLVHLTDATTCHCVLSRLDPAEELPDIMAAVSPSHAINRSAPQLDSSSH